MRLAQVPQCRMRPAVAEIVRGSIHSALPQDLVSQACEQFRDRRSDNYCPQCDIVEIATAGCGFGLSAAVSQTVQGTVRYRKQLIIVIIIFIIIVIIIVIIIIIIIIIIVIIITGPTFRSNLQIQVG